MVLSTSYSVDWTIASFPGLSPRLLSLFITASDKSLGDKPGNEASSELCTERQW